MKTRRTRRSVTRAEICSWSSRWLSGAPTSKLRRVNTRNSFLPRRKFGKVWGGDTVYFHSFRWVILKAIYLNTCTRKNFIWKAWSGEWNHPVTWIRASQAALVKLFVLAVSIANIQVKPSAPFWFHIVFMQPDAVALYGSQNNPYFSYIKHPSGASLSYEHLFKASLPLSRWFLKWYGRKLQA